MLRPDWDRIRQHRTLVTLGAAIAVFVVLAFAILFDIQPQDMDGWLAHERVLRRASASRFWLGASAGVALTGIAILLYTVLFLLGHFRTVYVCKKGVT